MKLRKKYQDEDFDEGEVVEVLDIAYGADGTILLKADAKRGGRTTFVYNSLAELNEEWEDYHEEPKPQVAYYIDRDGKVVPYKPNDFYPKRVFDKEQNEAIGNYFDTREEAELAVRKLKALKRLKDKGLKVYSYSICGDDFIAECKLTNHTNYGKSMNDFQVMLGFRGEE